MNSLNSSITRFSKLKLHERLLVGLVVIVTLYFAVDITLLSPQQRKLNELHRLDQAHQDDLAAIQMNISQRVVQTSADQAVLDGLKKQIADVDAIFVSTDATTSEVGDLLRKLLDTNPSLTMLSLKTLPVTPFYSPETKAISIDKAGAENSQKGITGFQKTVYKHGVEIRIQGTYLALLSYMESLHQYPKRLFWSEANLEVSAYPNSVLKLVVYSLSDQSSSPLR